MNKLKFIVVVFILSFQYNSAQIRVHEKSSFNKPIKTAQWEVNDLYFKTKPFWGLFR